MDPVLSDAGGLGFLADPVRPRSMADVESFDMPTLEGFVLDMLRIRLVEQKLAAMRHAGLIGGPVHLSVGQEAVAVGVTHSLRASDRVFGAHRSHSHLLALGSSIHGLFAEVLGKDTGLSRGMGGSMHLWDQPKGFYGSVPIVAGTVPLAVGAAVAARMQGTTDVGVSYLGDGSVEEGIVHESLNLARVLDAPVLFVVENNLFASHMHISLRQPDNSTARFAAANRIPWEIVDGNDVTAVAQAAQRMIEAARRGEGPAFLEAVTYRWLGHVDWRDDIDVGVHRSREEVLAWRTQDPIARLVEALDASGAWQEGRVEAMHAALTREIEDAWTRAMEDPYPAQEALLDRVFVRASR